MWLVKFVTIVAAVCLSACSSASLSEVAAEQRTERFGVLNKYYLMTWNHIVSGQDMEEVANDVTAIEELILTGTERVAIVVHGRESSVNSEFGYTLRSTLIQADREMVVILLDWSIIASLNYDQVVLLVPSIAEDLITFITNMVAENKLDRDSLHLIGFDLGAHIVGIASRNADARARKITALSPAGDRWDMYSQRLRVTDAQFVEVIHTDAVGNRAFGMTEAIGGLDFFPNGGTRQPGCSNSDNWCHHNRAWQLFAATVEMGGHLTGDRCDTMTQVNNNRCTGLPRAVLGTLELIKMEVGLYRVTTGRAYPYSA